MLDTVCKTTSENGHDVAFHANLPRCITTPRHLSEHSTPPMRASTTCTSTSSVLFPHRDIIPISLHAWTDLHDGVKPSHWARISLKPSSSPVKTGLLCISHQSLSRMIVVLSLNQRSPSNYVTSWVASASEQPLTSPNECRLHVAYRKQALC